MELKIDVKEEGLPQFIISLEKIPNNVREAGFEGLMMTAQKMVNTTKTNILSMFHSRSSNLFNSIQIIESSNNGDEMSVTIGSTVQGYPFYHEFGYTARLPGGRSVDIRPKFYMMNAIIAVAPEFPALTEQIYYSQTGEGEGIT